MAGRTPPARAVVRLVYLFGAVALLVYLVVVARALVVLFVWSGFLAYLVAPLAARLERLGLRPSVSALLVLLGLTGLFVLALLLTLPGLAKEGESLLALLPGRLAALAATFGGVRRDLFASLPPEVASELTHAVRSLESTLLSALIAFGRSLWSAIPSLVGLLLSPVVAFYLVADRARLRKALFALVAPDEADLLADLLWRLDQSVGGFLRGQLLVALGVGVLAGLTAWAFHLGYALLVGVVAGVTEVIPYVGPVLGAIPAVALGALRSPTTALFVALSFVAIHQVEGGILSPLIVGGEMGLTPLTILLALFVGGEVGGIVGLLLAVPATGALVTFATWLYDQLVSPPA